MTTRVHRMRLIYVVGILGFTLCSCGGAEQTTVSQEEPAKAKEQQGVTYEEGVDSYPCDYAAKNLVGTPLKGVFSSVEEMCDAAGISGCVVQGPTISLPGKESPLSRLKVLSGSKGETPRTIIAAQLNDTWYFSEPFGKEGEKVIHDGPLVLDEGPDYDDRVMVTLRFAGQGENAPFSERYETVFCSSGESGVPSCLAFPESYTISDQEGESPVSARLHALFCDDGSIAFYGNPTHLPPSEEEHFSSFIGRRRLVFP